MAEQYSMERYTKELCKAVEAYDYPAATYDFERGETSSKIYFGGEICHCKCKLKVKINPEYETHRICISKVEAEINKQLTSKDITEIVKGLGSIYYWGMYYHIHSIM